MGKIKILVVLGNTGRGGAQTYAINLLRNIDRNRFQMDFAFDELKGGYEEEIRRFGSKIYKLPRFLVYNYFRFVSEWNKLLKKEKYDIIHGHVSSSASIYLKIARRHGLKTILHSHSAGYRGNKFEVLIKKIFTKNAKKYADFWFSCSDKAAERLYGKDYAKYQHYYEIPNAINCHNYLFDNQIRESIRKKYNIKKDCYLIGHVGSFTFPKNHRFLLEIFSSVSKIVDSKLILVGDGPLEKEIYDKIKELGLMNKVILTGNKPNANEFMMAMDCMIFPSFFEGLPVTVVEAQATGLPILISDTITSHVILTDLVTVIGLDREASFWANKAINKYTENRRSYNEIVMNSNYEMERSVKMISQIYQDLIGL